MTIRERIAAALEFLSTADPEYRREWLDKRRNRSESEPPKQPDALDLYIEQYLDGDVLKRALEVAVRESVQEEITTAAKLIAQKFLYETHQGQAALREANDLLTRYPAIDYSVIEQLQGAIGKVIYEHFAKDRTKRPLSDG